MAEPKKATTSPRFRPGDRVRVKSGVKDPDFDDMPLGGWTGIIREVGQDGGCHEIAWDKRTLASIHPVFFRRCERDGMDAEIMWLGDDDLESDSGTQVPIEQPTAIRTPSLSMEDQDDRIRAVFRLTHDDLLPDVDEDSLSTYYHYLLEHATFPFRAKFWKSLGGHSRKLVRLTVTGLYDIDDYELDEGFGIIGVGKDPGGNLEFPLIEIEGIEDKANRRLIEDYSYWVVNWQ
jgi:calcium binding protein